MWNSLTRRPKHIFWTRTYLEHTLVKVSSFTWFCARNILAQHAKTERYLKPFNLYIGRFTRMRNHYSFKNLAYLSPRHLFLLCLMWQMLCFAWRGRCLLVVEQLWAVKARGVGASEAKRWECTRLATNHWIMFRSCA